MYSRERIRQDHLKYKKREEKINKRENKNKYKEGGIEEAKKEEITEEDIKNENKKNKKIEEMEIEGLSNMMVYINERGNGEEFINIYNGVEIMVTTEGTIEDDKYRKLPWNIEKIVIDKEIYYRRDEMTMMRFMSYKSRKEYMEEIRRNKKYKENNERGESVIYWLCKNGLEKEAEQVIQWLEEMEMREEKEKDRIREMINSVSESGDHMLYWSIRNAMNYVSFYIVRKMSEEMINGRKDIMRKIIKKLGEQCINRVYMRRILFELMLKMNDEMKEEMKEEFGINKEMMKIIEKYI